jgi:hypothetical protein
MIELKNFIKGLDDKDTDLSVGKAIANIMLMDKSDPLRSYTMATKIYSSDNIEFSVADLQWIKKTISEHGSTVYGNSLVSGQLLLLLSEIKDK